MYRTDVTFQSSGTLCSAWLYLPDTPCLRPCVILAHGFGGTRLSRLDAYAERFMQAGLAVLVFDYRHFGASEGEPRQLLDIKMQLEDWKAAISYARTLTNIDPERIALWGTSLSGGHVVEIAAHDKCIAAVVAEVPFMDGFAALQATNIYNALRLAVAGIKDEWRCWRREVPHYIKIVGAPGTLAVLTSPDAESGVRAMTPPEARQQNSVAARVMLHLVFYRPIKHVPQVQCPLLICVCTRDVIAPLKSAVKAAQLAPHVELRRYDSNHFDIFVGQVFEQAVTDQCDFLTLHLLNGGHQASESNDTIVP